MYEFGEASLRNLEGVHPTLVVIVKHALKSSKVDFSVVEGVRTLERQEKLVRSGKSWTTDSYHIARPVIYYGHPREYGLAVDIYPWAGGETDNNPESYKRVARAMFVASQKLGVRVEWGGFFSGHKEDKPHWQLVLS